MADREHGYRWVPSVYLMQGLPFAFVTGVFPVLCKNYGYHNSVIAFYTSMLTLPWVFKLFLAPLLENFSTKRHLTLLMQYIMAVLVFIVAINLYYLSGFALNGMLFMMIAFASAIHDINCDGLYLESLSTTEQAKLIGIRTLFYQIGRLLCQGGLLYLIGLFVVSHEKNITWSIALCAVASIILLFAYYNQMVLPPQQTRVNNNVTINSYKNVITELSQLPHLLAVIIFILFYQIAEAQLTKIVPLFMLDRVAQGGLELGVRSVGVIYGGVGICSILMGVTLSGFLLSRYTLKKCLIPFAIITAISNLSYLVLLLFSSHSIVQIILCIACAGWGFGLSNGAYMFYLVHHFSKRNYSMSLYAIGTTIMLLGMMLGGSVSGYLQQLLGYSGFFSWIAILGIVPVSLAIYNVKKIF